MLLTLTIRTGDINTVKAVSCVIIVLFLLRQYLLGHDEGRYVAVPNALLTIIRISMLQNMSKPVFTYDCLKTL